MFDMNNMQAMMEQATAFQQKLKDDLSSMAVKGSSGGDGVRVVINGHKEVTKIEFEPHVLKNPELLADLVLSALSGAYAEADKEIVSKSPFGGGNFDLSSLANMFKK